MLVVGLHGGIFSDVNDDLSYLFRNGICRIGVPFFFIVNGYFFQRIDNTEKLLKWGSRILLLYGVWMLLYGYFSTIRCGTGVHLWYLPAAFEACTLVYLLRNRGRLGFVLAIMLFVIGAAIQHFNAYELWSIEKMPQYLSRFHTPRNGLFFGFPLCYIGYLIAKYKFTLPISYIKHLMLTLLLLGLLLFESWCNSSTSYEFDILMSLLPLVTILFLFIMRHNISSTNKSIALISSAIYFIHVFWLHFINVYIRTYASIEIGGTCKVLLAIILSVLSAYPLIKLNQRFKIFL